MRKTFKFNQYDVILALNSQTIYMNIIDFTTITPTNTSYTGYEDYIIMDNIFVTFTFIDPTLCYKSVFEPENIGVEFGLPNAYRLIVNSFENKDGFSIDLSINNGVMSLIFNEVYNNLLEITMKILIKPRYMDSTVCVSVHRPMNRIYDEVDEVDDLNEVIDHENELKNITYQKEEEPICLFKFEDLCGGYLPIIPSYVLKQKLE